MISEMKVLGITGGVGAGKSTILDYLSRRYRARVVICDEAAASLQAPGAVCYAPMVRLLGKEVLRGDGSFDRKRVAEMVFARPDLLRGLNEIVHPAVKQYVRGEIEKERKAGGTGLFVVEAALLLEDHYGEICDEIWYVHADEAVRRARLRENRGYSEEKITRIMKAQRSETSFRKYCQFTVDNSSDNVENTYGQIDEGLKEHGFL